MYHEYRDRAWDDRTTDEEDGAEETPLLRLVLARVPERPPPVPAVRSVLVVLLAAPVALAGVKLR